MRKSKEWHDKIYVLEKEEGDFKARRWKIAQARWLWNVCKLQWAGHLYGGMIEKVYSDVFSLYWDSKPRRFRSSLQTCQYPVLLVRQFL